MSDHHKLDDKIGPEIDAKRQWAVYRCAHGCFHVSLDRVTLALSEDEFHALQDMMRRACLRFYGLDAATTVAGRTH